VFEAETPAEADSGPNARSRVLAASALAIATPFREAAGRPDPETVDMPALAMATVAAPVGVAMLGRFVEGLALGGLVPAIALALAGALICALMTSLAVITLWVIEAVARRKDKLDDIGLPRAYAYATAFLCTCGLPNNGLAGLCLLLLTVATVAGGFRRLRERPTPNALATVMTGPAIGFLAFYTGVTVFFASRIREPLLGMVSALLTAVFG